MRLRPPAVLLLALAAAPAAAQTLLKTWDGGATDDNFGRSVAFADDVNGDGYDDVIVGGLLAPDFATSIARGFVTDAQGKVLVTNIKGGGGPCDVYIQFVIKDSAQPKGFALSNTAKLHFLP